MQIRITNPNNRKEVIFRTQRVEKIVDRANGTEKPILRFFLNTYQLGKAKDQLGTDLYNVIRCEKPQRNGAWFVMETPKKEKEVRRENKERKIEEIEKKLEDIFVTIKGLDSSAKHYHNIIVEEVAEKLKEKYPEMDKEDFLQKCLIHE